MNENRKNIIQFAFILVGLVFLIKLFYIQVIDETYKEAANNNAIQKIIQYPYRGLVYDRYGKLIVFNNPVYDLMVIPKDVIIRDTALFCEHMGISMEEALTKLKEAKTYSSVKPTAFMKQISNTDFARIQEQLADYPGFYIQPRTVRSYPYRSMANSLGYIAEISKGELERDTTHYYQQGDYIGKSGIEKMYEKELRGRRGVKHVLVNVRGVEKGSFKDGAYDTMPIPGKNLVSSIDIELQTYIETLLKGKVGSVVAIEPSTGEILCMASSPTYDPNLLTGREYADNFNELQKDELKPLFNRPLMAMYRPGSIFKIAQSLVALQEGVIFPSTRIPCNRGIIACHGLHSFEDLKGAITVSCNPYFHNVFRRIVNQDRSTNTFIDTDMGLTEWRKHITSFGFGSALGIDLPNEKGGFMPNSAYYDKWYGDNRWKFSTIYSLSIGEGENLVVPVQMANFSAIMANKGFYYTPHIIKEVGENKKPLEKYRIKHYTTIEKQHFEVAVEAMEAVVSSGTGQYKAKLRDIVICGKTGSIKNKNTPLDHSVFIGFAPKDNPKIATAVYVEFGGEGARAAASITGLMIEKYLKGCISDERVWVQDYVLKGNFYQ